MLTPKQRRIDQPNKLLQEREGALTASLISSLCSSVNLLNGFGSCDCPWFCECAGGGGGCCDDFPTSAP